MTQTQTLQNYRMPVQPIAPVPILWNFFYDEIRKEAVARLNEAFKGVKNIEDKTNYQSGQPISFSNAPRNLFYHDLLVTTQEGLRVLSPQEMIRHWDFLPEKDATNADSNAVGIFPNPGPNEDLRREVLAAFGKTATTVPLLVTGLRPVKARNKQGFHLERTDFTKMEEAPYLAKNGKLRYDPKKNCLVAAKDDEEGVRIWTPDDQSGLRRTYRCRGNYLNFWGEGLLHSVAGGRVPVIQDPKGRAENLESLVRAFKEEDARKAEEMLARREKAIRFYNTGHL